MQQDLAHEAAFEFDNFQVFPAQRKLLRAGRIVPIGSRAFDILCVLCEYAGEAVTKERLIERVWAGRLVEEGNLRVHISGLRKALGEGRSGARYIANIPLKGYTMVLPVHRRQLLTPAIDPVAAAGPFITDLSKEVAFPVAATTETGIVHVVDDDVSLRDALSSLFRSVGLAVRTYGSPAEFLQAPPVAGASCMVLDVRLPGISGLHFQSQLAEAGQRIPIIFMTGHGDIPMSVQGMKAGAVDFLTKPFRDQDMLDAVTRALMQDRQRRATHQDNSELQARFANLSLREREVMALVTSGKMNKQVASQLGLSEITIKIHRGNAMRKMGARSLAEWVRMASSLNLPTAGHVKN